MSGQNHRPQSNRRISGRVIEHLPLFLLVFTLAGQTLLGQGRDRGGKIKPPTVTAMKRTSARAAAGPVASVLQPNRSPLVTFRILFMTGSASDPEGKEGVAALTAAMLAEGGSRKMSYDQITNTFYPMATAFDFQIDKEMTVFTGTTHLDNLDRYYSIISQMLLDPGFRQDDFTRLKEDATNFLKVSLREGNDEELGKEQLYNTIYASHPYGHHNRGSLSALERLTLNDVRAFYSQHYTRANLVLGLAGGYPASFVKKVEADFGKLPAGHAEKIKLDAPKVDTGMRIELVKRDTRSTGISLGFPVDVTRKDKDWPALAVVASYFGQHRSSNSFLYQRLRELRGLNYGDYAYIEYFPRGMFQFQPDPNLGRQQQIFQIWIRPVEPQNGHFALRAALYEYDRLVKNGMSPEAFEATRDFLLKNVNVLTATQDAQLGYALDSRYYGIPNFNTYMRDQLSRLTLADVNNAIQRYLKSDRMRVVMVTKDAEGLREAIINNTPSPIKYNAPKPKEITDEDAVIQSYRINVKPEDVVIVPIERVFQ
ncbi:MAG TPA: pitrilysin family protein [Pyrinomonadaceae bacterium]|jgi:zinc protease|nr:pitrilysin family protein [Pyrinomonadaceae bacterium]